jgi:hypothetical protein
MTIYEAEATLLAYGDMDGGPLLSKSGAVALTIGGSLVGAGDRLLEPGDDVLPELIVEIAWGALPFAASPVWVDVSEDVRALTIRRGRSDEGRRFEAGTVTMTLNNLHRAYDPFVRPRQMVRVRARLGTVTIPLFLGLSEGWKPAYPNGGSDAIVTTTVSDGFKHLARFELSTALSEAPEELSIDRVNRVLDAIGWQAMYRQIEPTMEEWSAVLIRKEVPTGGALTYLQRVAEAEGGRLFMNASGQIAFHPKAIYFRAPWNTTQIVLGDGDGELGYWTLDTSQDDQTIVNEAIVKGPTATWTEVDPLSIDTYGKTSVSKTDLPFARDVDAQMLAAWQVARFGEPTLRITQLEPRPGNNPEQWVDALQQEIGARLVVIRRPPGGGDPITQDSVLEGCDQDWKPGKPPVLKWKLTKGIPLSPVWTLDDEELSVLGTTTRPTL